MNFERWPRPDGGATSSRLQDSPQYKRGRAGERLVASILRSRGWFVVPSSDYTGENGDKAPKLFGEREELILPDLDVSKDGERGWVEVKTKATTTLHRMSGTVEHGISLRHWKHYRRVEMITGAPVHLMVVEQRSGEILVASLAELGSGRTYEGDKMGPDGMVFWPRERFRIWATVAPLPVVQREPVQATLWE